MKTLSVYSLISGLFLFLALLPQRIRPSSTKAKLHRITKHLFLHMRYPETLLYLSITGHKNYK